MTNYDREEAMRQQEATEAMIMMRQPDRNFNGPHPSPNSDTSHIDQIQDVRDYLRDNGQDGTLNNFDSYLQRLQYWHTYSLNILQRSHAELMVALNGAFGEICNPSLQADKWRDFLANISEVIGRAESLSISSTRIDASTSPPPEKALTARDALVLSVPEKGFGNERAEVTILNLAKVGWKLVPYHHYPSPGPSGYSPDEFTKATEQMSKSTISTF